MYDVTVLPNGVMVVTEVVPHVRSVSVGFWVKAGSRMESPRVRGVSHLIEHMLFKGTPSRTAKQIAEEMDSIGGQLNAYTSKEYTCYYAKCLDSHLHVAVGILSDILKDSLLDEADIEKEKSVVLEEIGMCEDNPDELAHDLIFRALWGDDQLGVNTLGERATVRSLTRDNLVSYMDNWYRPGNLFVVAVGNVSHRDLVQLVSKYLGDLEGLIVNTAFSTPKTVGDVLTVERDTEQVHLCIATSGASRVDPQRYPVAVLDGLLGGSMSSRLFQHLREERGLVYSTYSYNVCYSDTGLFGVYAGMSAEQFEQVVGLIMAELDAIMKSDIREDEVTRAKEQLKGNLVISLENTGNRMSRLAKLAMFHQRLTAPDELVRRIDAVTLDDVVEVAQAMFSQSKLAISAVGPIDSSMSKLLNSTSRRFWRTR